MKIKHPLYRWCAWCKTQRNILIYKICDKYHLGIYSCLSELNNVDKSMDFDSLYTKSNTTMLLHAVVCLHHKIHLEHCYFIILLETNYMAITKDFPELLVHVLWKNYWTLYWIIEKQSFLYGIFNGFIFIVEA